MTDPGPDRPAPLTEYVARLFAPEDEVMETVREIGEARSLPAIQISAAEGKLLQVLLTAIGARRVLEVGTLGGYSGVWIARALRPGGVLVTIERDARHADAAEAAFAAANLADCVTIVRGDALEVLPTLEPSFDAVFLDADKENMPAYFGESMRLLRGGGLLLADNAFWHGAVVDDDDASTGTQAMRDFNRQAAAHPDLVTTIVPVRDGLLVGVKRVG